MTEIKGSYTALVTPFRDGKLDEQALADFIEWQISEGTHGLVPCGTTGESPTLTHAEHQRVIELCIEVTRGRVPVMAGTGSNSTAEAIDFIQHAQHAGASSALIVAPYYNKPTQEGVFRHYQAIHDASDLPIIIYNIPGRSIINITDETLARLAELPRIAGVKDATGDLARVSTLRRRVGSRLALLSGEDMTAVGFNAQGGQGCISVTANLMPKACALLQTLTFEGRYAEALAVQDSLMPLNDVMFVETNPTPVKFALSLMGKIGPEIRLPLCELSLANQRLIRDALEQVGLL
ncbi:MAG: 4-hydroxy-tetrahydrodipicolinate synthase [Rickettsiales bacterium]|jgi:4-hydroxy-tetrahydrodipicolinate synthase|nr:4-hydroxy-tetrahydrodipicolinate synthase [Rickettsiales bacterium]